MPIEWESVHVEDCKAIAETTEALLIRFEDGREEWMPKSQIQDDSEITGLSDEGVLSIPIWLAEKKDLV